MIADRGRVPSGFDRWEDYDWFVSQGGTFSAPMSPPPPNYEADKAARLAALAAGVAAVQAQHEAANAAVVAADAARRAASDADMANVVALQEEARRARIAESMAADAAFKAQPGYTAGGVASSVIDASTPGVDLSNSYGVTPANVPVIAYHDSFVPAPRPVPGPIIPEAPPMSVVLTTPATALGRANYITSTAPVAVAPPTGGGGFLMGTPDAPFQTSEGWLGDAIIGGLGGFLTGGPAGAAIGATLGAVGGGVNPVTGGYQIPTAQCPSGYAFDVSTGQCARTGIAGTMERWVPGGATGYIPATTGQPSPMGGTSLMPTCPSGYAYDASVGMCARTGVVGAAQAAIPGGATGYVQPTMAPSGMSVATEPVWTGRRSCGPGRRLAKDGYCYPKGMRPAIGWESTSRKAVISYSDGKALRKGVSVANKLQKYGDAACRLKKKPAAKKAGKKR